MGTDIHAVWQAKTGDEWHDIGSTWEQDRHYYLFAWLADVRNGFGFAGRPTHKPIKPIAAPRGLPADFPVVDDAYHRIAVDLLSPDRRKWVEKWPEDIKEGQYEFSMGDHSYSWLSADEILSAEQPPEAEHIQYFVDEVKRLKGEHGEVRIVFGFDS